MKIEFVNHSSFILDEGPVRVMCDPWLEGPVFNTGWQLLSKTQFGYEDFKNITHIWFSHEHPDHFHPPTLKKIPSDIRTHITILFQESIDKRVVHFCRQLGFKKIIELKEGQWLPLSDDLKILCEPHYEGNSWILFVSKGVSIFNANDCGIRDRRDAAGIKEKLGDVDILLTQFSYAYWVGNREDAAFRRYKADEKLQGLKFQCDIFRPKVTIPIASFVWFCHEENHYMNDSVNTAERTYNFIKEHTSSEPVILYVGDTYEFGGVHDSRKAIQKYDKDYQQILHSPELIKSPNGASQETLGVLIETANCFIDQLKQSYGPFARFLRPAKIHLMDYDAAFTLSIRSGFKKSTVPYDRCDVSLSSDSLLYCFKFPWGQNTLGVNGRYQKPRHGRYSNFYNFFRFDELKSRGYEMTVGYLISILLRKMRVRLGLQKV